MTLHETKEFLGVARLPDDLKAMIAEQSGHAGAQEYGVVSDGNTGGPRAGHRPHSA